jgi:Family of unknown function (DUF6232)
MPQELLFELKDARVTPHIATFGGTSYQIANIGSVHVARRKRSNPLAVVIFLLGMSILAAAIVKSRMTGLADEYFSMAVTGVAVMFAALLLQLIWPGRVYVLILRTSSGDVAAITSRNKEFVSNLQKAVEQAFVVRAMELISTIGGRQLSPRSNPHEASTDIRRRLRTPGTQPLRLAQSFPHHGYQFAVAGT